VKMDRGRPPGSAASRAVDNAEQRANGELEAALEPGLKFLPAPVIHADLASASALAAPDEHAAARVQVGLVRGGERIESTLTLGERPRSHC